MNPKCQAGTQIFPCQLTDRVQQLIDQNDTAHDAATALDISPSYFSRLATGEKTNPSDGILRKLGLRKIVLYIRT